MRSITKLFVVPACIWALVGVQAAAEDAVSSKRDIRRLLSDRCFACHGPHEAKRKADLRLDIPEGVQGPFHARDGYQVIKPGDPDSSEIWERLTTDDPSLRMPPADSGKKPLTETQRELV